ncbi:Gfo/Idh/MocA family protein [Actinopolymorpha singaporensis]|uniref:Predicted dehydrogenase n=1 Tax=Actinopolymorpha singaporensis TaxID=117157 RepID=A0A1H1LL08_9ACTN|nr:Gfo/Idh/MocA family oxidoreductase [Actinopolymorpha singaporensis]SDR74559.1 Predicted dehydrogenase [Actinopolymorpha singaporensis]
MQPRLRWGIVATGNIAGVFARELALLPDHEVVAVGSRNLDRAKAFAQEWDIRRAYGSYTEVAEDPEVDVVYVATPHSDHLATTRHALESGKAVLCEKALTVNAAEARQLVDLARKHGQFLMEAMWMRCNPLHLRLRELLDAGTLGEPRSVHATLGFLADYDPDDRLFAPHLAGGSLLDVGIYPVSLAHHLLGAPDTVRATGTLAPTGVDATAGLLLGYAGGAVATLTGSLAGPLPNTAYVSGTEGWVEIPADFQAADRLVVHHPDKEPEEVTVDLLGVGYTYEAEEVARCLRAGLLESPLVPWADSIAVMEVLDAARAQVGVRYPNDEPIAGQGGEPDRRNTTGNGDSA